MTTEKKPVKKVKKKKRRKLTPIMKLICVAVTCVSIFFLYSFVTEIATTVKLQREVAEVQAKLQEVTDQNAQLNSEKKKLQDPDYIGNFARGKYMISKAGEQIFVLPSGDDAE